MVGGGVEQTQKRRGHRSNPGFCEKPSSPASPTKETVERLSLFLPVHRRQKHDNSLVFQEANLKANIQLEVDQLATAYNISCTGLGLTLVSDTLLYKVPPHPDMYYYKLDSNSTTRKMYLYHKRSHYLTLAMQKFMDNVLTERPNLTSLE